MAPKYKLTYFNGAGIGDPIRFAFLYGNIDFEDNKIELEDWPKLKPQTPYGVVPFLEVDGKVVCQSLAILRYIGTQVGLTGSNDWENVQIDMMMDTIQDYIESLRKIFQEKKDETRKAQLKEALVKEQSPFLMKRLEEEAKKNGGYLANGKLSIADFMFANIVVAVEKEGVSIESYPTLKALKEKVYEIPQIKDFIAKRG